MRYSDYSKYIYFLLILVIVGICALFGNILSRDYRVYKTFVGGETRLQKEAIAEQDEYESKKTYLTKLLKDPKFFAQVARERLGYAAPDEIIYRFEEIEEINETEE